MKRLFPILVLALACLRCGTSSSLSGQSTEVEPTPEPPMSSPSVEVFPKLAFEEIGQSLGDELIDLQQMPDGDWLVASRSGMLYRLSADFQVEGQVSLGSIESAQDDGLQNIELAPDFATSGQVYVYFTPGFPDPTLPCETVRCRRLDRFRAVTTSGLSIEDRVTILNIPAEGQGAGHSGGAMSFAENGDLFLATGDGESQATISAPQEGDSLLGKILRITPAGDVSIYAPGPEKSFYDDARIGRALHR